MSGRDACAHSSDYLEGTGKKLSGCVMSTEGDCQLLTQLDYTTAWENILNESILIPYFQFKMRTLKGEGKCWNLDWAPSTITLTVRRFISVQPSQLIVQLCHLLYLSAMS